MTSDFLRAFLRAGAFVALVSLATMFVTERNSAEFVVSVCSLFLGVTMMGGVFLLVWLGRR